MIAIDTNALVRLLIEDDLAQSQAVQEFVLRAEEKNTPVIVLPAVLVETVWVLESVYRCNRNEITGFVEALISTSPFKVIDTEVIRDAVAVYKNRGDFADLVIVFQSRKLQATALFSFDKKLEKTFPAFVKDEIDLL